MVKDLLELCINFEGKLFLGGERVFAEMIGFPKSLRLPKDMSKEEAILKIKQFAPDGARGYSVERENDKASEHASVRYYKSINKLG